MKKSLSGISSTDADMVEESLTISEAGNARATQSSDSANSSPTAPGEQIAVIIDGKESDQATLAAMDPDSISKILVMQDAAKEPDGQQIKAKNGKLVVTTKKNQPHDAAPDDVKKQNEGNVVYEAVEIPPVYPGGEAGLVDYLKHNVRFPKTLIEELGNNDFFGRCIVQFVVNEDCSVGPIKVLRSSGNKMCDAEAVRVASTLHFESPGYQGGKAVKVYYTLPVTFRAVGKSDEKTDSVKAS